VCDVAEIEREFVVKIGKKRLKIERKKIERELEADDKRKREYGIKKE